MFTEQCLHNHKQNITNNALTLKITEFTWPKPFSAMVISSSVASFIMKGSFPAVQSLHASVSSRYVMRMIAQRTALECH
jgi:hypothetical protein